MDIDILLAVWLGSAILSYPLFRLADYFEDGLWFLWSKRQRRTAIVLGLLLGPVALLVAAIACLYQFVDGERDHEDRCDDW